MGLLTTKFGRVAGFIHALFGAGRRTGGYTNGGFLEGLNGNQTIRQIIRRLTPEPDEKVLEYSTLGRGILLFEGGAFSQDRSSLLRSRNLALS